MDKKPQTDLPTISTIDSSGVRWEFDPSKHRWGATVAGKKMSSGDFDKLRDKVNAAAPAPAGAPTAPPVPEPAQRQVEVAMVSISYDGFGSSKTMNLLQTKLKLDPVLVKMEWNAQKGTMEVVRYKGVDGGWKQRNTDSQILFHPSAVPDPIRDLLSRVTRGRVITNLYRKAESEIAQAWWRSKPDQTDRWEIVHEQGLRPSKHEASSGNSRSVAYTNPGWVLPEPESLGDLSDWSQSDAGDLRRDGVSIKMVVSDRGSPTFVLHMEGTDHSLFSDSDITKVMALANATHFMMSQPEAVLNEWAGSAGWEKDAKKMGGWPTRREVHAAALFEVSSSMRFSHGYPEAFVLAKDIHETMSSESPITDRRAPGLEWKAANPHYYPPSFRNAGPEDAALQPLAVLRAERDSFEPDRFSMDGLIAMTPVILAEVAGMVEDGEELTTDLAVMANLLKTLVDRTQDRHTRDDALINWQQRCLDTVDQARSILSAHDANPSESRKHKP